MLILAEKVDFERKYSYPWFTVKRLGDIGGWKVVSMKVPFERGRRKRKNDPDNVRFDSSVARTRTAVKELAMCNPWTWFVTLTLSPQKVPDRHDLEAYHSKLTNYIRGLNKRRDPARKITYLLVPEKHQDGAWHMHGLMNGLDEKDLITNDFGYCDWPKYKKHFGWISMGRIRDRLGVIAYICKYINKGLAATLHKTDAHMYYRSRGLLEPSSYYRDMEGVYNGKWSFKKPEIGMSVAYTRTLDDVELPESGAYDIARELAEMRAELKAVPAPQTPEELWGVLDGYAPITFADDGSPCLVMDTGEVVPLC